MSALYRESCRILDALKAAERLPVGTARTAEITRLEDELDTLAVQSGNGRLVARYTTDEGGEPFTLAELVAANVDAPLAPADLSRLRPLPVGGSLTLGGGAVARTTITRVR